MRWIVSRWCGLLRRRFEVGFPRSTALNSRWRSLGSLPRHRQNGALKRESLMSGATSSGWECTVAGLRVVTRMAEACRRVDCDGASGTSANLGEGLIRGDQKAAAAALLSSSHEVIHQLVQTGYGRRGAWPRLEAGYAGLHALMRSSGPLSYATNQWLALRYFRSADVARNGLADHRIFPRLYFIASMRNKASAQRKNRAMIRNRAHGRATVSVPRWDGRVRKTLCEDGSLLVAWGEIAFLCASM